MKKIDLHIHTKASDGTDCWRTVLSLAESANLSHISITDHNNVDAYLEMQKSPNEVARLFSGKIITGIEPEVFYRGRIIEVLGYGIDINKMDKSLRGVYMNHRDMIGKLFDGVFPILKNAGLKFSDNVLETFDFDGYYYPTYHFHADFTKYPENKKIITDKESWENPVTFFRTWISNPKSSLYFDESHYFPSAETVIKLIKDAGGKVFVPHVFLYGEDSVDILENLVKDFEIDGVECYYPMFTKEQTDFCLRFCAQHNLLVSAGSDYHGYTRPNKIGTGVGADEISWLD